jgi:hypothetical protein
VVIKVQSASTISQTPTTISWTSRFFSRINPYHNLETRIQEIAQQTFNDTPLSTEQTNTLRQAIKLAHGWTWPAGRMRSLLQTLPNDAIQVFIQELLARGSDRDVDFYLEQCLGILNNQSLLELSGFSTTEKAASWYRARGLIKETALRTNVGREGLAILREFIVEGKCFFHQILNILVIFVGLSELSRARASRQEMAMQGFQVQGKIESFWKLVALPATIYGMIHRGVQFKTPAVILTGVIITASLVALVAYNRYWVPCPIDHFGMRNLSIEMLRNNDPIYPRADILTRIESAFRARKGVILVGKPGAGKSWIVRSFVQQALAGKICRFIQNPQIFYCNASTFKSFDFESCNFASIEDQFKKHPDQVVFFFDELHALFKADGLNGTTAADELKTFCEEFKYVIGATTTQEYEKHIIDQTAIADRRFEVIHVGPMKETEIKIALSQHLESRNFKLSYDVNVIDYIIEKARNLNSSTSQIDAAQSLLSSAIQKMTATTFSALEQNIVKLEESLGVLEGQMLQATLESNTDELEKQILAIKAHIAEAKSELSQKKQQVERLKKIEAYYLKLKQQTYRLANPQINLMDNARLARVWMELHAKIRATDIYIAAERMRLGFPVRLDRDLIDEILSERSPRDSLGTASSSS